MSSAFFQLSAVRRRFVDSGFRRLSSVKGRAESGGGKAGSRPPDQEGRPNYAFAVQVPSVLLFVGFSILIFGPRFGFDPKEFNNRRTISRNPRPKAASRTPDVEDSESDEKTEKLKRPKRARVGLRERQIIAYENRIRTYSQPDKVFRLFATVTLVGEGVDTVLMTPEDFVRSILPGKMQPEGAGLDQFVKVDRKRYQQLLRAESRSREGSFFGQVCCHGLLTFSDYLFLLVVLSTPRRNFEIAFRMLDMNGDGEVQIDEFLRVYNVLSQGTAVGQRHKSVGQSVAKLKSALQTVFFGQDGKGILTYQQFLTYVDQLNREVLAMEFDTYEPWQDRISELDVADSLLAYSSSLPEVTRKMLRKRVKRAFGSWDKGVTLNEFVQLTQFAASIERAAWIFQFPPRPMTPNFLQEAARLLGGVELSEHIAKILLCMFSERQDDGTVTAFDMEIFFRVLRQRQNRGLDRRGEAPVSALMSAIWTCGRDQAAS